MKWLFIILLINACTELSAQDSIQRLKLPELHSNRILSSNRPVKTPLTTSQKIEARINSFLDSMVRTADASPFLIQKVKAGVNNILIGFWRSGLLTGANQQEQAYFVQCNAQTMTQKDIADGRLVVIVSYALLKPAEFEIRRFERILINKTPLQYASQF
jgi:phage tail sheath protein FI